METLPANVERPVPAAPLEPIVVEVGDDNTADALAAMSRRVSALETEEHEERQSASHVFLVSLAISVCASLIVFALWHGVLFILNRKKAST